MSEESRVKPPTKTDKLIMAHLKKGRTINHVEALNLYATTSLRDGIYRLRKAGHVIESKLHFYKNESGQLKHHE